VHTNFFNVTYSRILKMHANRKLFHPANCVGGEGVAHWVDIYYEVFFVSFWSPLRSLIFGSPVFSIIF
jgi:hypothetical protein